MEEDKNQKEPNNNKLIIATIFVVVITLLGALNAMLKLFSLFPIKK